MFFIPPTTVFQGILRLTIVLIGVSGVLRAQDAPPPALPGHDHEVRAVWVTTVGGLDWPRSTDTAEQKASLIRILDATHTARFNTIFFQVRGRGDAIYAEPREPWSAVMTGRPGADPGWDPLGFIIREAHRRGMEVHAWFNTCFVRGVAGMPPATDPPHVIAAHPEWVKRHGDEWWMDPGIPGVRSHLAGLAADIVRRYDLDGIQLDYIRYPGAGFDDEGTYAAYGGGMDRGEWRRASVTALVREIGEAVRRTKPWVKLGCTPIGIYRNPEGVRGLESFTDVYQDSYRWVREGLVDYIVPQLYWPIGGLGGDPDFAVLAREWRKEISGRHLYLGVGTYKPEVERQTMDLIGVARKLNAEGIAFFRYASLSGILTDSLFPVESLPPPMPWKDSLRPPPPRDLSTSGDSSGVVEIRWVPPPSAGDPGDPRFVCLYRVSGGRRYPASIEELIGVFPSDSTVVRDSIPGRFGDEVTYIATALSRSGLESVPVGEGGLPLAADSPAEPGSSRTPRLGAPFAPGGREVLFVPFHIPGASAVRITILDASGGELLRASEGERISGNHVITLDISTLQPGSYLCRLSDGGGTADRSFVVPE